MFGYSVPTAINHGITVEEDTQPPAGRFITSANYQTALDASSLGINGTGIAAHTIGGRGLSADAGEGGTAVYGFNSAANGIAIHADCEGENGVGLRCTATQSGSAAISIHGPIYADQAITHTLGSYSGKAIPLYDTSGTLVGHIPVYN